MNKKLLLLFIVVISFMAGFFIHSYLNDSDTNGLLAAEKNKPLYWVAPMDPNYQRDKPGKSPMGMDLIPYYAQATDEENSGAVFISPSVVNNLGVRTQASKMGQLHFNIKTVGYVKYSEDTLQHVHPRVEGWVEKLYVKAAGDPVVKGEALYALYSPQLVNAQEEYLLALRRNNKSFIQAAKARLQALQLPNKAIKFLQRNRKVQQHIIFDAPQSGVIDRLNIREGFFVKPGTTLMSIAALDEMWVEAEIFEQQASLVSVGQAVEMRLNYLPGRKWAGKIDYIYPSLDPETRTLRLRLRFDNSDLSLKPNMFADISIQASSLDNALLVPKESVIRFGDTNRVVLALGEGQYKSVNVAIGRMDDNFIEIVNGLFEGDEVVVSAQFLLDSESSKTSDFKRMQADNNMPQAAWVTAVVTKIMEDKRMLTVSHESISQWRTPAMVMQLAVSNNISMSQFEQGKSYQLKITNTENGHLIIEVKSIDSEPKSTSSMSHTNDSMVEGQP